MEGVVSAPVCYTNPNVSSRLVTRLVFPCQSKLKSFRSNSPIHHISCGFRELRDSMKHSEDRGERE